MLPKTAMAADLSTPVLVTLTTVYPRRIHLPTCTGRRQPGPPAPKSGANCSKDHSSYAAGSVTITDDAAEWGEMIIGRVAVLGGGSSLPQPCLNANWRQRSLAGRWTKRSLRQAEDPGSSVRLAATTRPIVLPRGGRALTVDRAMLDGVVSAGSVALAMSQQTEDKKKRVR
jgi:hypothetical protein